MLYKSFKFSVKQVQGDGIIRGYASTFGNVDQGDDVVVRGAFKRSINNNPRVPILDSHNPTKQIGINLMAEEDSKGLFVEGKLNLEDPLARSKYSLIKLCDEAGAKMGLSIGYRVVNDEFDRERGVRFIKECKLFEYSVVAFPMNEQATITEAKAKADLLDFKIQQMIEDGHEVDEIHSALKKRLALKSSNLDSQKILHSFDDILKVMRN